MLNSCNNGYSNEHRESERYLTFDRTILTHSVPWFALLHTSCHSLLGPLVSHRTGRYILELAHQYSSDPTYERILLGNTTNIINEFLVNENEKPEGKVVLVEAVERSDRVEYDDFLKASNKEVFRLVMNDYVGSASFSEATHISYRRICFAILCIRIARYIITWISLLYYSLLIRPFT